MDFHATLPRGHATKGTISHLAVLRCGTSIWPMSVRGQPRKSPSGPLCQVSPATDFSQDTLDRVSFCWLSVNCLTQGACDLSHNPPQQAGGASLCGRVPFAARACLSSNERSASAFGNQATRVTCDVRWPLWSLFAMPAAPEALIQRPLRSWTLPFGESTPN